MHRLVTAFALVIAVPAYAQEPAAGDTTRRDTTGVTQLPELEVTVTRSPETLARVPFAVGVLDRDATPAGDWPFWYAGVIELVCGALILLGVLTRAAAFLSSGAMAFAYFTEHQPDGLFPLQNGGLSPALFCWGFLLLVFFGPGALSLSGLFRRDAASGGRG